jgi:hypothetical protein
MKTLARLAVPSLLLALILGPTACGDDKPTGPGNIGESDQGTAQALVYDIVVPLLRDMFLDNYIDQIPPPGAVNRTTACEPLAVCTSGSAEYCTDPGTLQVNFTNCDLGNTTIDGSVSLTLAQSSGAGTFSLSINGNISMTGSVSYSQDSECFNQTFSDVVITANDLTILMGAAIGWCDPRSMVGNLTVPSSGFFNFRIDSLDRTIDVTLLSDPAGDFDILVLNSNRTQSYLSCEGSLAGTTLNCSDLTEF